MAALTVHQFGRWLERYGQASQENDPQASADLFALDAQYYETPFDEPMIGRDAIFQYWDKGAHTLRNKESTYEILSVNDNLGIARWQAKFTDIHSGKRQALDCVFLVEFDDAGKCRVFREWWHIRALDTAPNEEPLA
jgi:hypothetical protein